MTEIKTAAEYDTETEWIPTSLSVVNKLLGGGIPMGKILEISGSFSVGKSTLALIMLADAQKAGKKCLWADIEYSFQNEYATRMGVNTKKLFLLRERFAESAIDEIEKFAESNKDAVIVVDAIGAMLPRSEAEKESGGKVIGGQARLVASFCRKMAPLMHENNICVIALNHSFRDIMTSALKTSGGLKLEYHKSVSLNLRKGLKKVMKGEQRVGDVIEIEVRKNKLAPTLSQKGELIFLYGDGFQKNSSIKDEAIEAGILTKEGQFWMFKGEKLARGDNGLLEVLKNEEIAAQIKTAITELTEQGESK